MTARDDVLARIRTALGDEARPDQEIERRYRTAGTAPAGSAELVDLFEDRLVDYRATVRRTTAAGIAATVAAVLAEQGLASPRVVVPAGLDPTWVAAGATIVDDGTLSAAALDDLDAVVTACALAIAETGTIVLDAGPDQGRRAISLVPDLHLCVVRIGQIVESVCEAVRLLDPVRPLTWISGGSATSDIELQRVEGVHGPRTLVVLLVDA